MSRAGRLKFGFLEQDLKVQLATITKIGLLNFVCLAQKNVFSNSTSSHPYTDMFVRLVTSFW
jgi:hypothetical protein